MVGSGNFETIKIALILAFFNALELTSLRAERMAIKIKGEFFYRMRGILKFVPFIRNLQGSKFIFYKISKRVLRNGYTFLGAHLEIMKINQVD